MPDYIIKGTTLTDIADAIREKTGTTREYKVNSMPTAIRNITGTGGGVKYWEGTLKPEQDELIFPVLDFTPRTIVVSSVYRTFAFDDGSGYAYSGFLCTAFYDEEEETWFEVIPLYAASGVLSLGESSHSYSSENDGDRDIYVSDGQYHFNLRTRDGESAEDIELEPLRNQTFKCRVYG